MKPRLQTIVLELDPFEAEMLKSAVIKQARETGIDGYGLLRDQVLTACTPDEDQRWKQLRTAVWTAFASFGFLGVIRMLDEAGDEKYLNEETRRCQREVWAKVRCALWMTRDLFVKKMGLQQ